MSAASAGADALQPARSGRRRGRRDDAERASGAAPASGRAGAPLAMAAPAGGSGSGPPGRPGATAPESSPAEHEGQDAQPQVGGALVICPTPIGNLEDITLRALRELRGADAIACEDTRRTGLLLARHQIQARTLLSYHEHNELARSAELAERIARGERIVLVSDAGMPLLADPGYRLLRACIERELPVEVLPGASAVPVALVASGLAPARWCFTGFLPRKRAERMRLLEGLRETTVAFESPLRLARTLAEIAELDARRAVAVCRELSKLHEEVRRGAAAELAAHYAGRRVRGEVVLVIAAGEEKK